MALFNFGKKKEVKKETGCCCGSTAPKAEEIGCCCGSAPKAENTCATICMKHPRLRYRIWVLQSKSSM